MLRSPSYIDPLRQPACGRKSRHGRRPASCSIRSAFLVRVAARPAGVIRPSAMSSLARRMFTKLKVYSGPNHPHGAQNPQPLP